MQDKFDLKTIAVTFIQGDSNKRPVVFVHGNSQNDTCGIGLMQFFSSKGHSFLSYDLPGHGDSKYDANEYTLDDLLSLNQSIFEQYDIRNPILCGHSFGGMLLAGCISKYQLKDVSLILCGSYDSDPVGSARSQKQNDLADNIEKSMSSYIEDGVRLFKQQKKFNYFENRQTEDMILDIFNRRYNNPKASSNNIESLTNFSAREELIKLDIPVLVLHGESETVIPKPLIEEMVNAYSNIRLEWYPKGGHNAFYKDHESTVSFLEKHLAFIDN